MLKVQFMRLKTLLPLFLLFLLSFSLLGSTAISVVAHDIGLATAPSISVTTPAGNTTGSTVIWLFLSTLKGTTATGTISSVPANTWTFAGTQSSAFSSGEISAFYCESPVTDAAQTFTFTGVGADYPTLSFVALTNTLTTGSFDPICTTTCRGGNFPAMVIPGAGPANPSAANEIWLTAITVDSGCTTVSNTVGTVLSNVASVPSTAYGQGTSYLVQTAPVPAPETWNLTGGACEQISAMVLTKGLGSALGSRYTPVWIK